MNIRHSDTGYLAIIVRSRRGQDCSTLRTSATSQLSQIFLCLFYGFLGVTCLSASAWAERKTPTLRIAVASNFQQPMHELAARFEQQYSTSVDLVAGASGKLLTQLRQGAPFDLLFMADQATVEQGVQWGLLREASVATYSIGRLALVSLEHDPKQKLLKGELTRVSVASPVLAPYGRASMETLRYLNLDQQAALSFVYANNVSQVFQQVYTRAVSAGFVAYAQFLHHQRNQEDMEKLHHWLVPEAFHQAIYQDMAITQTTRQLSAARAFREFILSSPTQALLVKYGYTLP